MNGYSRIAAAVAAGFIGGWLANAQIVQGQQGQKPSQKPTPVQGTLSHVSFAVNDVEKTARAFADVFGIENVAKPQDFRDIKWGPRFPGKVMHTRRMGFTINGVSFEFLQPLDGESPWKEFIQKSGEGVHHIGFSVPDVAKARAYLESKGGVQTQDYSAAANYVDMTKAGLPITFEVTGPQMASPAAPAAKPPATK